MFFFFLTRRVFFAVFFTALFAFFAFFAFLAMLPSDVSEMAQFAACTRESRCTSSRIHQHIEKNSVPLKEVLTQRCDRARSAASDDNAMRRNRDARNAAAADVGVCQDRRKALCCSRFLNLRNVRAMQIADDRESLHGEKMRPRGL